MGRARNTLAAAAITNTDAFDGVFGARRGANPQHGGIDSPAVTPAAQDAYKGYVDALAYGDFDDVLAVLHQHVDKLDSGEAPPLLGKLAALVCQMAVNEGAAGILRVTEGALDAAELIPVTSRYTVISPSGKAHLLRNADGQATICGRVRDKEWLRVRRGTFASGGARSCCWCCATAAQRPGTPASVRQAMDEPWHYLVPDGKTDGLRQAAGSELHVRLPELLRRRPEVEQQYLIGAGQSCYQRQLRLYAAGQLAADGAASVERVLGDNGIAKLLANRREPALKTEDLGAYMTAGRWEQVIDSALIQN